MVPQTGSDLSRSLFHYANENETVSFSDSEAHYSFLFGMSYNTNVSQGQMIIVEIFSSLLSQKSSGLMRGVALHLDSASVSIDGLQVKPIEVRVTSSPTILIVYLTSIQINAGAGKHLISARLLLSTIDVNYLGYFGGSEQAVNLNGTIVVV